MITGQSVVFQMDDKYLIPTAERRARRARHQAHPHSKQAFKAYDTVPIGRPGDVEVKYEIPYKIRREISAQELQTPKTPSPKKQRRRKIVLLTVAFTVVWVVLACIR